MYKEVRFDANLFELFDKLIVALESKDIKYRNNIEISEECIEYFLDNLLLRTAIVFYLHRNAPPFISEDALVRSKSEADIQKEPHLIGNVSSKLLNAVKIHLASVVQKSRIEDLLYRCNIIIEELLWVGQREQMWVSSLYMQQKKIASEVGKVSTYVDNLESIRRSIEVESEESRRVLSAINDEVRRQKIDALTMTTIVFTAFTFLAVNAGVISGISQINTITMGEVFLMYFMANSTVLFGIYAIMRLLNKLFKRDN